MKAHVRKAHFQGEPTSLERFMAKAMWALATYENRSLRKRFYDRRSAIKLVTAARRALWTLQRTLERITEQKQLDRYLENLYVAARQQNAGQPETRAPSKRTGVPVKPIVRALLRRAKLADKLREQYRSKSPKGMLNQLSDFESRLTLALEKLKFQPGGDFQRDEIAREFADAMVFAWMSATGVVPTISKSRSLAFQQLLATINRKILRPEIKHKTDFQSQAVRAADRARRRIKGNSPRP
jgi:hypothetical protein